MEIYKEPPWPHQGGDHGDDSSKPEEIEGAGAVEVFVINYKTYFFVYEDTS